MPDRSHAEIVDIQLRLARVLNLSPQEALFMALLVCYPTVTAATVAQRIGQVDQRNLVARLRKRLLANDEKMAVHTVRGFGFCLDDAVRARLANAHVPRPVREGARV